MVSGTPCRLGHNSIPSGAGQQCPCSCILACLIAARLQQQPAYNQPFLLASPAVLELFSGVLPPPQEGNASAPSSSADGSKEELGAATNSVGASKDSSLGLSEGTEATGCEVAGGMLLESERGMAVAQPVEVFSGCL